MSNKKRVIITGSTGFIGQNLCKQLNKDYELITFSRKDLNLLDLQQVQKYFDKNRPDFIIHAANPAPVRNTGDTEDTVYDDILRMFENIYACRKYYQKLIYFGSGAEFDRSSNICNVSEEDFGKNIPKDAYGLAKYDIMQRYRDEKNTHNLRLFGCYGPGELDSRFITYAIQCCINNKDIIIRKDCYFDYIFIDDVVDAVRFVLENDMKYFDYNVCSGTRILLSDIAKKVVAYMHADSEIKYVNKEYDVEYTASNRRLKSEIEGFTSRSIDIGIKEMIELINKF